MQNWAVSVLEKPEDELLLYFDEKTNIIKSQIKRISSDPNISDQDLPDPVSLDLILSDQAKQLGLVMLAKNDEGERYIHIARGSGFVPGNGIKVGKPSFRADRVKGVHLRCWKDGVYAFSCY